MAQVSVDELDHGGRLGGIAKFEDVVRAVRISPEVLGCSLIAVLWVSVVETADALKDTGRKARNMEELPKPITSRLP